MPTRPQHPCAAPACPVLLPAGVPLCPAHAVQREHMRWNYADRRRYRIKRWLDLRDEVIRDANHRCAQCGQVFLDLEVDHIRKPLTEDLFWERTNLQPLCRAHHQEKTNRGE